MQEQKYDYIFKIVIIGNGSCGKSSILHYFVNDKAKKNMSQTVGVEFASKLIHLQNKSIKLQLWDTAGQERYQSVARTYYRGALGAIVVYDLTSLESYATVAQWIKDAKDYGRSDISVLVVGNKSDLVDLRRVNQAEQQLKGQGIVHFETSAMTGHNVEEAFNTLANNLLQRIETGQIDREDLRPRLLSPMQKFSKLQTQTVSDEEEQKQNKQKCSYC